MRRSGVCYFLCRGRFQRPDEAVEGLVLLRVPELRPPDEEESKDDPVGDH